MSARVTAQTCPPIWAGVIPAGWREAVLWCMTAPTTWAISTSWGGENTLTTWAWWAWATASGPAAWSPWWDHLKYSHFIKVFSYWKCKAIPLFLFSLTFSSSAQGILQDEDLWEGELRRSDVWADWWLWQHHGPLPHVQLHVLQCDGGPLADVWAAPLQRQDDVHEARRVQELHEHHGKQHKDHEHEAHHRLLLLGWYCTE